MELPIAKPGMCGKIKVSVISAAGLKIADITGKSDPYCKLRIGNNDIKRSKVKKIKSVKTKVIKHTLNPTWNETFEFELVDGYNQTLYVDIWDWDRITPDDFLGFACMSLAFIPCGHQLVVDLDVQNGKGSIRLGIEGVGFGYFRDDKEFCIKQIRSSLPPTLSGVLELTIVRAEGLKDMDVIGSCDPFVISVLKRIKKKKCKKQKHKTKVKKGKKPVWGETFAFNVVNCKEQFIELKVMDFDRLTSNDAMGLVILPLRSVVRGVKQTFDLPIELGKGRLFFEVYAHFGILDKNPEECWKDTVEYSLELAKEVMLKKSKKKKGTFKKLLNAGMIVAKVTPGVPM